MGLDFCDTQSHLDKALSTLGLKVDAINVTYNYMGLETVEVTVTGHTLESMVELGNAIAAYMESKKLTLGSGLTVEVGDCLINKEGTEFIYITEITLENYFKCNKWEMASGKYLTDKLINKNAPYAYNLRHIK